MKPLVMGVLNMTPDSFSDGGRFKDVESAFNHAWRMVEEGADIIDVGGESTRPGSFPVRADQEMERVLPVIEKIRRFLAVTVSIDTSKAKVAESAIELGASIVNDVSAGEDPEMKTVISRSTATWILMHKRGEPSRMQERPEYSLEGVVSDVRKYLEDKVRLSGIPKERVWVDPGIGFGKTTEHNIELLRGLARFEGIGERLVVGTSRKSFLGRMLGLPDLPMEERESGTIATNIFAFTKGASVFRVHDVGAMKRALKSWEILCHDRKPRNDL